MMVNYVWKTGVWLFEIYLKKKKNPNCFFCAGNICKFRDAAISMRLKQVGAWKGFGLCLQLAHVLTPYAREWSMEPAGQEEKPSSGLGQRALKL